MPQQLSRGNCQYTVLNTAGTTTLNPGQASGPPISPLVFFGMQVVGVGIGFAFVAYDVVPATPSSPSSTNTLLSGTATAAGQAFEAGVPGVGVRCQGGLVVVTSGTPGAYNGLWD